MIRIYRNDIDQFVVLENTNGALLEDSMVWFDLDRPSGAEEAWFEETFGIELPTREDMKGIEPSSRLYRENGATYMTGTLIWKADSETPEETHVGFILVGGRLVTIRYAEPRPFTAFQLYAARNATICSGGATALLGLMEAIVDRTAEILEHNGAKVEKLSQNISSRRLKGGASRKVRGDELEKHLSEIVACQNLSAKIRDSLMSLARMVSFMPLAKEFENAPQLRENIVSLEHDIKSLLDHTGFLNGTLNFLLDAALGLINIEQNSIIKIFSIAAVVFLPPTLVASIYGMNFHTMPELDWRYGYPMALCLMVLSAVGPYMFFKRKGWL
ncbi:MAG: magnesium transporter [Alphaproteobacteria bacterium]|nr:MAG: magnesium transporter [Alphaproteobacteria bacterium]